MGAGGLFYGMPGQRGDATKRAGASGKPKRARRTIDRKDKGERLAALKHASSVVRAVRGGAEPDDALVKLQGEVSPEQFEATLRALNDAPAVPQSLRALIKEQPEPAAPSQL